MRTVSYWGAATSIRVSCCCEQSVCRGRGSSNISNSNSNAVTEDPMSSPPTERARKQAISEAWLRARRTILPSLIDLLRTDLPLTWIKAADLFNESTLPVGLSTLSFSRAIFRNPDLETFGSDMYFGASDGDFVYRHPFRNSFYLCSCCLRCSGGLDPAIKEDILRVPKESNCNGSIG